MEILNVVRNVKDSAKEINFSSGEKRDEILRNIKEEILKNVEEIIEFNEKDLKKAEENNMPKHLVERLTLNRERVKKMAESVDSVISLKSPVDEVISGITAKNGLQILNVRVPLGVVGMIYESRPNITLDAAILCIKSANAVVLRGGKEAINTNKFLVGLIKKALEKAKISSNVVGFIENTNREDCLKLMRLNGFLDVLIPRGGKDLIKAVVENATVPVIETGVGNCHVYVDEFADLEMALKIVVNAKVSRPSVCNSAESLLVHEKVASSFLKMLKNVFDEKKVELFGCEKTIKILKDIKFATEEDFYCEYLDYKMSVKIVSSVEEAVEHILKYSSKHSEAVVTNNYFVSQYFLKNVDSAAVYVNASTRFTDGAEFEKGAEIGISTQKLHARGPLGLKELTTNKFIIKGTGQIRE